MKYFRNLVRASVGIIFASAWLGAACGGEKESEPANGAAAPGGTAGTTATGSLQPGAAGNGNAGTNGATTEGPPAVVGLDPNRDATTPVNLGQTGAVPCGGGGNFCVAPNATCCTVPGAGGGMGNNNNTFSCAASAADCPADATSTASCSSQLSCGSGQSCCRVDNASGNGTAATCESSCAAGADQLCNDDAECGAGNVCNNNNVCGPAPCTADSCGAGELCCRGMGGGANAPACAVPGADGSCPDGRRQVCADATSCPTGDTCSPLGGGNGGGGLVCTPPPCTPTSCAAGQVCCVGGGIATPTCSAASATGECNGMSRLVCITDADCAPSPGRECLLNPNGGGSLSCRVPPPPVSDAGVADAG
jgi:hypothetical protein